MKVHLIAIGGSAMHNMAIALHKKGFEVTGSDDEVFEPSKNRLQKYGLLPDEMGWNPNLITTDVDAIILGMHARKDNPELIKAEELGLKIYSYPEYIYEQSKNKKRVVIGGSHGKTSITAMILHVLNGLGKNVDYMVGAQLAGFETMVKLSENADTIILEGDEYLSSPIDLRPKFHLYKPHIAVLSGVAWDHINVFPTFENYVDQFQVFTDLIEPGGTLIYFDGDEQLNKIAARFKDKKMPYNTPLNENRNGVTFLKDGDIKVPLMVFGAHNLQNMNAALHVCLELGVSKTDFYNQIKSFKGASKRLELVNQNEHTSVYKDFAHSPSKLKATSSAVKNQFQSRSLVACMELHTFSSLTKEFLKEYENTMDLPDSAIVYFNPKTIVHKKLKSFDESLLPQYFKRADLKVFTDSGALKNHLLSLNWENCNLLLMSSGNFDGINFDDLGTEICK